MESYTTLTLVDDKKIELNIWDTAGMEDYRQLRSLVYQQTDVFVLMFSVTSPTSFSNIIYWQNELKYSCPNVPVILVGNKIDIRNDLSVLKKMEQYKEVPISHRDGIVLAREINAVKYLECSSYTQQGVDIIFEEAIKAALKQTKRKKLKRSCSLM